MEGLDTIYSNYKLEIFAVVNIIMGVGFFIVLLVTGWLICFHRIKDEFNKPAIYSLVVALVLRVLMSTLSAFRDNNEYY